MRDISKPIPIGTRVVIHRPKLPDNHYNGLIGIVRGRVETGALLYKIYVQGAGTELILHPLDFSIGEPAGDLTLGTLVESNDTAMGYVLGYIASWGRDSLTQERLAVNIQCANGLVTLPIDTLFLPLASRDYVYNYYIKHLNLKDG